MDELPDEFDRRARTELGLLIPAFPGDDSGAVAAHVSYPQADGVRIEQAHAVAAAATEKAADHLG
ncbi:MAG TPA: hypothetical protein VGP26_13895 [Actinophytocola sp.]|jgi:hypothetical protein|nr:hypothetical protein [Actinophytocola sp.]